MAAMVVCPKTSLCGARDFFFKRTTARGLWLVARMAMALTCVSALHAQDQAPDWQAQVRKYAEAKDWDSAMRVVEQELARAP